MTNTWYELNNSNRDIFGVYKRISFLAERVNVGGDSELVIKLKSEPCNVKVFFIFTQENTSIKGSGYSKLDFSQEA